MATTETPLTITMNAVILSGERRGEIADIIVGEPNGAFINDCENPPDFVPEKVEAVFTDFLLKGKKTTLTLAFNGSVMDATDPELTDEEQEAWEAVVEASKKAEATAIRAGETARRIIEKTRASTAALRAEEN